ncbi:MAG: alpha-ketoacid dehydrogenase subunit beta [Gemmatimonadetes bacterium]|uniref:Alpha-ketoacid dehydrogenase subunit beta n=1 Tax=Candidatus Kutchimonas denitrificans TaxID=3056748 RepID=A0AAE4Z7W7_9BACT|nr:alpha-ketoacid dehydrogenase subunit beta [Gemmatimonadota bacterium]NIR74107.1 alpha-ketoacid dehydrogenase subunit beta [Candidatus Kutchimonas denitrificans]NIS01289.1 alpha-ketoacid dehydrogenase subunit beta [Gemmatimonadota bacterium]NIT67020.1 alpha-ketoacid dehydrogenase subunit beta [Gemmatimonadota bacterium]NIU51680.1 alpha-ketoacid dehydrogenase subunit beta [Gemmatimonadota bacterium]
MTETDVEAAEGNAVTYLQAIRDGLREEMEADESVFLLGEDIGRYGGAFKLTDGFQERFGPDRVLDTPISEAAIVGVAIGASQEGLRPVVEMQFIDFIGPAFDVLVNFAAKLHYRTGESAPIVVRGPCGGGGRAGPFHSQNVESYFLNVAGLKMVAPSTAYDAKGLLKSAIRDPDPVLFFEHKFLYRRVKEVLPVDDYTVPIGSARIARPGDALTIVTFGAMVHRALEAAGQLASADRVEVEVLDLRTLNPLDDAALVESVKKTGRCLVVHEAPRTGGIAGELAARVNEYCFEWLDAPVRRVTGPDTPVPFSPPLEDYYLVQVDDITKASRWMLAY